MGLLLMAYGTPARPEDIEGFYRHIRRGRAPTPELLADLTARYAALGGTSPLAERTEAQRAGLASALEDLAPGRWEVVLGQKHAPPFVEDGVAELAARGVDQVVGLVLAPHYSAYSAGEYHRRAQAAAAAHGMEVTAVESWHLLPEYVSFLAGAVSEAAERLPRRHKVLFTAHSLPERVLLDDPYPDQLLESASAAAGQAGLDPWSGWALAWQSAGRTPEPWRGPDILDVIAELGATGGLEGVLVCPQGFVSDHLEVLYDLDIEAAAAAASVGLAFARTRVPNDDPEVLRGLARLVSGSAA